MFTDEQLPLMAQESFFPLFFSRSIFRSARARIPSCIVLLTFTTVVFDVPANVAIDHCIIA